MGMLFRGFAVVAVLCCVAFQASAGGRGSGGSSNGSRSSPSKPGTGNNPDHHTVSKYERKDGAKVAPYERTNRDGKFENNYSTQGNTNPFTGKPGTKTTP